MTPDTLTLSKKLAVEMTARTGELWRTEITDERNPHIYSQSAWLRLSESWKTRGRLIISASAPREMREAKNGESVTLDPSRPAAALAADIDRRLLQSAQTHLSESAAYDLKRRKTESAENLRRSLIKRFAPKEGHNGKLYKPASVKGRFTGLYVDIHDYDNTAAIEITLDLKDALKLLKHIEQGEYIK